MNSNLSHYQHADVSHCLQTNRTCSEPRSDILTFVNKPGYSRQLQKSCRHPNDVFNIGNMTKTACDLYKFWHIKDRKYLMHTIILTQLFESRAFSWFEGKSPWERPTRLLSPACWWSCTSDENIWCNPYLRSGDQVNAPHGWMAAHTADYSTPEKVASRSDNIAWL